MENLLLNLWPKIYKSIIYFIFTVSKLIWILFMKSINIYVRVILINNY